VSNDSLEIKSKPVTLTAGSELFSTSLNLLDQKWK